MRYREYYPQTPLSRFVECFWTLESDTTPDPNQPERILPDGCTELILNYGAEFQQHNEGKKTLQPRNFLVGQMTGPILISPIGIVSLLGIRFNPGGTSPGFRIPMCEVSDQFDELGGLDRFWEVVFIPAGRVGDLDSRCAKSGVGSLSLVVSLGIWGNGFWKSVS